MALVVDGEANSWASAGVESAVTLFEKDVPFRILSGDREERKENLTVRILMGVNRQQNNTKTLRVQLSSEDDPFFVHNMEVGEEDFTNLKTEQCILVDFATFPSKIVELLEACEASRAESAARFVAVLNTRGHVDSRLSIVETNQFKELSHISLAFRPGNDTAIKQYLAGRLFEVKGAKATLAERLRDATGKLDASVADVARLSNELAEEREVAGRTKHEMTSNQSRLLAEGKQRALDELKDAQMRAERERQAEATRHAEQAEALAARVAELDAQVHQLQDQKYALDSRVSDLSAKLGTAEGELAAVREDCKQLRAANGALDKEKHEQMKEISQHLIRLSSLEQQVADKDVLLREQRQRLDATEAHATTLDSSWKEVREGLTRAEERAAAGAAEIRKGNQIIEKLQSELRAAKAKLKMKALVIEQQEVLLHEKQGGLDKAGNELSALGAQLKTAAADREGLKERVEDKNAKLEESRRLLESNQKMIQWLNQQLNEAQLGKLSASSRYAFRPSLQIPSAAEAKHGMVALGGGSGGADALKYKAHDSVRVS